MQLDDYLLSRYAVFTAKHYKREIIIFLSHHPNAQNYRQKDVLSYLDVLRAKYTNGAVINRIWCSVKAYYKYLQHVQIRKDNPAQSVYLKDKKNKAIQLQDLLNEQELEKLLYSKTEIYFDLDYRNKVLMSLLIYQALKPNEIAQLQVGNINLSQCSIYVPASKNSNSRTIALKASQILLFKTYLELIRPKLLKYNYRNKEAVKTEQTLMISLRGSPMTEISITKQVSFCYGKVLASKTVNCQTIRQSVITNLLSKGNDLRIVQSFAGHKLPSTTEKYYQKKVEELQAELSKYHPFK
jgi:integrase/recombinase XerD